MSLNKISIKLLAPLMFATVLCLAIPKTYGENFSELRFKENKLLLSSVALSISNFEHATHHPYQKIYIFEETFNDNFGMLNLHSGVGAREQTTGLIIVLTFGENAYVYYNGTLAYRAKMDDLFDKDLKTEALGTQLYAISNYDKVNI